MASITKRGPAQWQAKVRRTGFPTRSKTFESFEAAKHWADVLEGKISGDEYVDKSREQRTLLREILQRYLEDVTPSKKGALQETNRIKLWLRDPLADMPIISISSVDIADWRKDRQAAGKAPSTIANMMNLLSAVFKMATSEWGYRVTNPVQGVKRPPARPARFVVLSTEDEAALLESCKQSRMPHLYHCVRIAITTGARASEIRGLRWEHIHFDQMYVHLVDTKNGEKRDIPLTEDMEEALREVSDATTVRRLDGYVFGDPHKAADEGGFTRDSLTASFRIAKARVGVTVTFHDLRHVALTRLAELHRDALDLAGTSGHKTVNQLRRYYNPVATDRAVELRRKAAEIKNRV